MCKVLEVSSSGYYDWLSRRESLEDIDNISRDDGDYGDGYSQHSNGYSYGNHNAANGNDLKETEESAHDEMEARKSHPFRQKDIRPGFGFGEPRYVSRSAESSDDGYPISRFSEKEFSR